VQTLYRNSLLLPKLAVLAFFFLTPSVSWASHIVGGEMTYKFLSRNPTTQMITYRITLHVYHDLYSLNQQGTNTPLDQNAQIAIYLQRPNNTFNRLKLFTKPLLSTTDLPRPVIPCSETPKNVGADDGLYEWDETLRDTNGSYFIAYQRCCRNAEIKNIPNPTGYGGTYFVEITPDAQRLNNSSPVFNGFPPAFICEGDPLNFDHSARDTNNDQIVYRFCNAYTCPMAPPSAPPFNLVPYLQPYSAFAPMKGNPIIKIDPNTGIISGTPDAIPSGDLYRQLVVTICAEEYRDGQLIGRIFRDFQFNVVRCKKLVVSALVADSASGKSFFINGCESVKFSLINQSFDRANVSNFRWEFLVGSDTIRYREWSPNITFTKAGIYRGALLLNPGTPCSDTAYVTVRVGGGELSKPSFTVKYDSCVASDVEFKGVANGSLSIKKILWDFGDNTRDSNKLEAAHLYTTPGDKAVKLSFKDIYGCGTDTTMRFNWQPAPPILIVEPDNFTGCAPAKVRFNNRSSPLDTAYTIVWDFGDGTFGKDISPTHTYAKADTFTIKLTITSPIGCYKEAEFRSLIKIKSVPKADFDWSPKVINNLKPQVSFTDQSTPDVIGWRWFFSSKASSTQRNPPFTYRDTGVQDIKLYVINGNGCRDSAFKKLYIEPEMTFHLPNAFSPNFDSVNDEFKGSGFLFGLKAFRLTIWNRWGEKVFETRDPSDGWNGSKNNVGNPEPEGVYLYEAEWTTPKNEIKNKRDFLTLFR
jgi:gliding motility-associated-like protein